MQQLYEKHKSLYNSNTKIVWHDYVIGKKLATKACSYIQYMHGWLKVVASLLEEIYNSWRRVEEKF